MEFGVSVPHGKPGQHTDYGMIREAALECERLGFDSIYLSDHVVPRPNTPYPERDEYDLDVPYLECWTLLSALAVETTDVKLGTFTLCNSFRQPPSLLAKMAATLDHVSGGRLIFGIGAGYNELEYAMYGVPYPRPSVRIRQLEEAIRITKMMWTEERPTFEGRYYTIREAIFNPKPLQEPPPTHHDRRQGPKAHDGGRREARGQVELAARSALRPRGLRRVLRDPQEELRGGGEGPRQYGQVPRRHLPHLP